MARGLMMRVGHSHIQDPGKRIQAKRVQFVSMAHECIPGRTLTLVKATGTTAVAGKGHRRCHCTGLLDLDGSVRLGRTMSWTMPGTEICRPRKAEAEGCARQKDIVISMHVDPNGHVMLVERHAIS